MKLEFNERQAPYLGMDWGRHKAAIIVEYAVLHLNQGALYNIFVLPAKLWTNEQLLYMYYIYMMLIWYNNLSP